MVKGVGVALFSQSQDLSLHHGDYLEKERVRIKTKLMLQMR